MNQTIRVYNGVVCVMLVIDKILFVSFTVYCPSILCVCLNQ